MLLVLTGVTAVSVALLAYVNELTKGPIAEANAKTLNEALKKVLPEFTNNPVAESDTIFSEKDGKKNVDFIVYPAKNGEELVGTAVEAKSMGFGGELKVLVALTPKVKSIITRYSLTRKLRDWALKPTNGLEHTTRPRENRLCLTKRVKSLFGDESG